MKLLIHIFEHLILVKCDAFINNLSPKIKWSANFRNIEKLPSAWSVSNNILKTNGLVLCESLSRHAQQIHYSYEDGYMIRVWISPGGLVKIFITVKHFSAVRCTPISSYLPGSSRTALQHNKILLKIMQI